MIILLLCLIGFGILGYFIACDECFDCGLILFMLFVGLVVGLLFNMLVFTLIAPDEIIVDRATYFTDCYDISSNGFNYGTVSFIDSSGDICSITGTIDEWDCVKYKSSGFVVDVSKSKYEMSFWLKLLILTPNQSKLEVIVR